MKMILNFVILTLLLTSVISCRTLSGFPTPVINSVGVENNVKSDEDVDFVKKRWSEERNKNSEEMTLDRKKKYDSHQNNDFSFFLGRYVSRQGILEGLGELGPSFGVEFVGYAHGLYPTVKRHTHGFFVMWTFDHFWETNGKILKPEFKNQDYTNYLLGLGYAYRFMISDRWQFHYRGGLGINFIEIDTFRTQEDDVNNDDYKDVTASMIHKIGFDFLPRRNNPKEPLNSEIRFGPSLFYYFAPDPLGKFKLVRGSKGIGPGGSMAILLELKLGIY